MRPIRKIHRALPAHVQDLITFRALPTRSVEYIDPFLFLNHHGPQVYPPNNNGLPFGPHPHRGMETVTFIIDGDVAHADNGGHKSVIDSGGIQWMTAGKGLIHAEVSSPRFKKEGGKLEILQLWLNLPRKYKMTDPFYKGVQVGEIPVFVLPEDAGTLELIAGVWEGNNGAVQPLTDVFLSLVKLKGGAKWTTSVPAGRNIFLYVVRGMIEVNGKQAEMHDLVEFELAEEKINISAGNEVILIFGHATPLGEPVVSHGPFVMNTQEEIMQAFKDYEAGAFGSVEIL